MTAHTITREDLGRLRLMRARYASVCQNCGGKISKGDPIAWVKGFVAHAHHHNSESS